MLNARVINQAPETAPREVVPSALSCPVTLPAPAEKQTRLCIDEEQQFFKDVYELSLMRFPEVRMEPKSTYFGGRGREARETIQGPDVMLLGFKTLSETCVRKARVVRNVYPSTGIVMLSGNYETKGIKAFGELSANASAGLACLLKHSVNTVEDLVEIIRGVSKGRFILDPEIVGSLTCGSKDQLAFAATLNPREMEILRWATAGYNDNAIAGALSMDIQALRKHFSRIYAKLDIAKSMEPRVDAVMQYISAFGVCPPGSREAGLPRFGRSCPIVRASTQ